MSEGKGIDFGRGNRMGNVNITGDVAGRDVVKITTTPESAAAVGNKEQLLALVAQLRADVERLSSAPDGDREDAQDELRKAQAAGERGDGERLAQKLSAAQRILESIGAAAPAALSLAQTIGGLIQKASMLT